MVVGKCLLHISRSLGCSEEPQFKNRSCELRQCSTEQGQKLRMKMKLFHIGDQICNCKVLSTVGVKSMLAVCTLIVNLAKNILMFLKKTIKLLFQ